MQTSIPKMNEKREDQIKTNSRAITHIGPVSRDNNLHGVKVAIPVSDGSEQVELAEPKNAANKAGAQTRPVSPKDDSRV